MLPGGLMTPTAWYFLRLGPGELRSIPRARVDAFFDRGGVLPFGEDGFVRYAQLIVLLQERRAVEVERIGYFKYRVLDDGRLDVEHRHAVLRVTSEAMCGPVGAADTDVVEAGHRFARRQMEHLNSWKPTDSDLIVLRDLVNKRAATKLM